MKFTTKYSELVKAVQSCTRVIAAASPSPILTNILIDASSNKEKGLVRLFATDLEMYYEIFIAATIEIPGDVMVSAKIFNEILGSFSGETEISFNCNTENFNINLKNNKLECTIFGIAPDDFPALPFFEKIYSFNFSLAKLQQTIKDTLYAASVEQVKPVFCGLCLKPLNNGIRAIATDGKRLAFAEYQLPDSQLKEQNEIIIMAKVLNEISKCQSDPENDEIEIMVCSNQIAFKAKSYSYYARLIEGKFPDYNQVIPKDKKLKVIAKVSEFSDSLKKTIPIAKDNSYSAKFNIADNMLVCSAKSTKIGSMELKTSVAIEEGESIEINFNVKFFIEILSTIKSDECIMEYTTPQAPVKIYPKEELTNENHIHILMPVRPGFTV